MTSYNPFLVYCRELAPGTVSLTGDRAQGDDSKHDSLYNWSFSELFLSFLIISPEKNCKTSKVNQQSLLNLKVFYHFPKNLDKTITFNSGVTLKNTQTEFFFFSIKQIKFRVGG